MSEENSEEEEKSSQDHVVHDISPVNDLYKNWFLDYASYVILERAVPALMDGLKPVQRRILHAMKEIDDGRFNKVANIIGSTMQFHPHGDASINDAMVNMGQKDLLIETQGNWGDVRTGDSAAAPRYIEARLSKFASEVAFNPQLTQWQMSYDGRKREPVFLPMKFPLLLAQGVEGIAVGLATKVMPHNFIELCDASVKLLNGKKVEIFPDFLTGGMADFSNYNEGRRGGKIKVRARIEIEDKKTLVIKDIPFSTTTMSLMDSIVKANDQGKIKIKQVIDSTAKDVEIQVVLASGTSPDITMDALYAFTDCEVSISPNACVIVDDKPQFLGVNELLRLSTFNTKDLLQKELEIRKGELLEKRLFSSLEKIFIENRIYRDIEECETWEAVIETIDKGLEPYKKEFYRTITRDDIVRLTEIKIKRISKFDSFKADELMRRLEEELKQVEFDIENINDYTIAYFQSLKQKYGEGRERKTEIRTFDSIEAHVVAANNVKLYVNREEGFAGYGLKKDEYVCDCSDLDDIIAFRKDGKFVVTKISDKGFLGKDILHVGVFQKGDERMIYHAVYHDGKTGRSMIKRFQVLSMTRDKEYDITSGAKGSLVTYFSVNPNGENEIINVKLTAGAKARVKVFDFDFSDLDIKGRGAKGNILTKYPVRKIELLSKGSSTLGGLDIWYDDVVGRLNKEDRGVFLGSFDSDDKILVIYKDGHYELTDYELTNKYDPQKILLLQKFNDSKSINVLHYDGDQKTYYVKRFLIETSVTDKKYLFINEAKGSKLVWAGIGKNSKIKVTVNKGSKGNETHDFDLSGLIDVKGWKATGNKFALDKFHKVESVKVEEEVHDKEETKPKESIKRSQEIEDKEDMNDDVVKAGTSIDLEVKPKPKDDDGNQLGMF